MLLLAFPNCSLFFVPLLFVDRVTPMPMWFGFRQNPFRWPRKWAVLIWPSLRQFCLLIFHKARTANADATQHPSHRVCPVPIVSSVKKLPASNWPLLISAAECHIARVLFQECIYVGRQRGKGDERLVRRSSFQNRVIGWEV